MYLKKGGLCTLILGILFYTFIALTNPLAVYGEEKEILFTDGSNGDSYSCEDLLERYEIYSTGYEREGIKYQIEALKGKVAAESYIDTRNTYLENEARIEELTVTRDKLIEYKNALLEEKESRENTQSQLENAVNGNDRFQEINITDNNSAESSTGDTDLNDEIASIDAQIASIEAELAAYQSSSPALERNTADAKLSEDIAAFYSTYKELITEESRKALKHSFLKECLNLILSDEQIKYYKINEDYLNTVKEIADIKVGNGLAGKEVLDAAGLDLLNNGIVLQNSNNDYRMLSSDIRKETNLRENDIIYLSADFKQKYYNIDETVSDFINHNIAYLQLKSTQAGYENYLSSLGAGDYYKQIELTVRDYKLQRIELGQDIENYVKNALYSYQAAFTAKDAAKKKLEIIENKCKRIEEKLKYKKASTLELKEAYVDREAAKLAYYKSLCDIIIWQNILDNYLYGESAGE